MTQNEGADRETSKEIWWPTMVLRKRRLQIVQVACDEEQPDNCEPALPV